MLPAPDQILTVAQMRAAEQALIDAGTSVEALMRMAGRGAGEWVWRLSGGRAVTVLCGPGNNGGDGWVLAELIRERGGDVAVIAPKEPATDAARDARSQYGGTVIDPDAARHGEVFVDCLFGSGLNRALPDDSVSLIERLAGSHHASVAVDLPSGVESDSGALLNDGLPHYDLTIALGAWKFAHWSLPAMARMGERRLVEIGCGPVDGAAKVLTAPALASPTVDAHKYTRGLLGVIAGKMPGAALLSARAAQHAGAGYVKLLVREPVAAPPDLVVETGKLPDVLFDKRYRALLVGPGLGRDGHACERLVQAIEPGIPLVIDADALTMVKLGMLVDRRDPVIATPHAGELVALEREFGVDPAAPRRDRVLALARGSMMIVVAKGADTMIAAPDGRLMCAPSASSWLSTAGTGDVLAGIIAGRLAAGAEAFTAACEGVWLHGEAARLAGPAFTAGQLAEAVQGAVTCAIA